MINMKKLKKGIIGILAFVMIISQVINPMTVIADETFQTVFPESESTEIEVTEETETIEENTEDTINQTTESNGESVSETLATEETQLESDMESETTPVLGATEPVATFQARAGTPDQGTNDAAMNDYMRSQISADQSVYDADNDATYRTDQSTPLDLDLTYSWRVYVNEIWQYKAIGDEVNSSTDATAFKWAYPEEYAADGVTKLVSKWDGTYPGGMINPSSIMPAQYSQTADSNGIPLNATIQGYVDLAAGDDNVKPYPLNYWVGTRVYTTFHIYSGAQLRYALEYLGRSGFAANRLTLIIERDIDLCGYNNNWDTISLYQGANHPRLVIEGNSHTIYNLGIYHTQTQANRYPSGVNNNHHAAGLVLAYGGLDVRNLTFESAKIVANDDAQCPSVGIFGATEVNTVSWKESAFVPGTTRCQLWDVQINNSMFFNKGVGDGSNVSALGKFSVNTRRNPGADVKGVTVDGCYLYGGDHVAGLTTANYKGTTEYSYVVDTLIATYGGHSGGFMSCNIGSSEKADPDQRTATIKNCFASVDMYAAFSSGGFVGLFSGEVENCFSTGKLEGFYHCAGFYAAASNAGVFQGTTITSCYSTVLVGMRSGSNSMGGFYVSDYVRGNERVSKVTMKDCYAAGEVGDISVDSSLTSDAEGTKDNGGFSASLGDVVLSSGSIVEVGKDDTATNCYYDKQTTAMREWVSGDHNPVNGATTADASVETSVVGVVTEGYDIDSTTHITGLADGVSSGTNGFTGFSDDTQWEFKSGYYPQLEVFSNADAHKFSPGAAAGTGWTDKQAIVAKEYALISTSTVFLDNWSTGYTWDSSGVRSADQISYKALPTAGGNHVAGQYTYDTVREMITDAYYSNSQDNAANTLLVSLFTYIDSAGSSQIYNTIKETTEGKYTASGSDEATLTHAFDVDTSVHRLSVLNPGMAWMGIFNTGTSSSGAVNPDRYRPLRLVSSMKLEAGQDTDVYAGVNYNHREEVRLTAMRNVEADKVLGMHSTDIWSTTFTSGYARELNGAILSNDESVKYHQVVTNNMDHPELDDDYINDAWLYTEIRRVEQYYPGVGDDPVPSAGQTTGYVYTGSSTANASLGTNQYWWAEPDNDGNWGVYLKTYATPGSAIVSPYDTYVESESININGSGSTNNNENNDEKKWNGTVALYPDSSSAKKYVVTYFWVLKDGRYRTDNKVISIKPGFYNMYMNSYTFNPATSQYFTDTNSSLYLYPKADVLNSSYDPATDKFMYSYSHDWTGWPAMPTNSAMIAPDGNNDLEVLDDPSQTFDTFTTDKDKSLKYTEDAMAAWMPKNNNVVVNKIALTMYARNGDIMGQAEAPLISEAEYNTKMSGARVDIANGIYPESGIYLDSNGIWKGHITISTTYYSTYIETTKDAAGNDIKVESTKEATVDVTYVLHNTQDSSGAGHTDDTGLTDSSGASEIRYFFEAAKSYLPTGLQLGDGVSDTERGTNGEYNTEGIPTSTDIYINDTMYNMRFDFYIEVYELAVTKNVQGNYGISDDLFEFQLDVENIPADTVLTYRLDRNDGEEFIEVTSTTTEAEKEAKSYYGQVTVGASGTLTMTFKLSHNDVFMIENLPKETKYTLKEAGGDFTTSLDAKLNTNSQYAPVTVTTTGMPTDAVFDANTSRPFFKEDDSTNRILYGKFVAPAGQAQAEKQLVRYNNKTDYVPPTGVVENSDIPWIWMIVAIVSIGALSIGIYGYNRQKSRKRRRGRVTR